MSLDSVAIIIPGALGCAYLVRLVYRSLFGFSRRSPNDVLPFLRKIDMEALYGTFHPEAEEHFRVRQSPQEFKRMQRKRFYLAIHYCNDLAHNSRVFLDWARYEYGENWAAMGPELQKAIQELRIACTQCRLSTFFIRMRLHWWLLRMAIFPFAEAPSFDSLHRRGSADMIAFYDTARALAEAFSQAYGPVYHQKLTAAL